MTQPKQEQQQPNLEAYIGDRMEWIKDAVEVVSGDRQADPLEVLPPATGTRDDAEALPLTDDQETKLREVAGRFGVGGEADVTYNAEVQLVEGGKPWKIIAEIGIIPDAGTHILAASPHRIIGQDEADYMRELYKVDLTGKSEYDVAQFIAGTIEDSELLEEPEVLPFGYDIHDSNKLVQEATGQLIQVAKRHGEWPLLLLRVDREDYQDEEGASKYRNQPDSAALMGFISGTLSAAGDETSRVGLITSNTYASRAIDTVRAGLQAGREFGVSMYGRRSLAETGAQLPVATSINQIPGELHVMYEKLINLQAELAQD